MTIDLIERMARAIYEDRNGAGCVPWSRRDAAHKKPYRADALAALKALREPPSPAAMREGHRQIDWCRNNENTYEPEHPSQGATTCAQNLRDAWTAIIDAEIAAAERVE